MKAWLKKLLPFAIIHKRFFLSITGLTLVFSLLPLHAADAIVPLIIGGILVASLFFDVPIISDIGEFIGEPILGGLLAFFNIILGVIAGILQAFYTGIGTVMHDIIRYFMGIAVSPANPDIIPFVKDAFNFSQMFVNSLFILVLVFIGLATILRIQSYQIQRTLPLLLVVALLVNFSGVLVGFVVDMGNIVAIYFLNASIDSSWWAHPWQGINLNAENVGQNIARILYYTVGSFIYFIVMLLFGVRVIVLWTLTILAPFAFAALVLPATRSYWTQWWSQLVQWSIIGIPISFFLYLSGRAISADLPPVDGIDQLILAMFAPISALVLLLIGVMFSMQLAPAGASKVVDFGKKWASTAVMAAGGAAWRKLEGANIVKGGGRISNLGSRIRKWGGGNTADLERQRNEKETELKDLEDSDYAENADEHARIKTLKSEIKTLKTDEEEAKEKDTRPWYRRPASYAGGLAARTIGGAIEFSSKEATMRMLDRDVRQQQEAEKEVAGRDSWAVFNMYNLEKAKGNLANKNRMVGLMNAIRGRRDSDDIEDAIADGSLKGEDIGMSIKTGLRAGPPGFRPLLKSFFGQIMLNPEKYGFNATSRTNSKTGEITFEGKDAKFLSDQLKSIPTKFTNEDFQGDTISPRNFDMKTKEGKFFMQTIAETRGADFMSQILRRPKKAEGLAALNFLFKQEKYSQSGLGAEWLAKNAPDVLRYGTSTAAQGIGLSIPLSRPQVEDLIRKVSQKEFISKKDLLNQHAILTVQLEEQEQELTQPNERGEKKRIRNQIDKTKGDLRRNENKRKMMDIKLPDLQAEIKDLEQIIIDRTNEIDSAGENLTSTKPIRLRAAAEIRLITFNDELATRGTKEKEEYIAKAFTDARTQIEEKMAQLDTRAQELRNFIQQAQGPTAGALDSSFQQQLTEWEAELTGIPTKVTNVELQLRIQDVREAENIQIPKTSLPLPASKVDMRPPLRKAIKLGNDKAQEIVNATQEMQRYLQNISASQTDFNKNAESIADRQSQIVGLDQEEEQNGTLTSERKTQRNELQDILLDLNNSQHDLEGQIQQQAETTLRVKEELDSKRANLQDIKKEITPLFEHYTLMKQRAGEKIQLKKRNPKLKQ